MMNLFTLGLEEGVTVMTSMNKKRVLTNETIW